MKELERLHYKPGHRVPRTGIYRIYHDLHRLMHEAALVEGTRFPLCKQCKDAVRFELARPLDGRYVLPFRSTALLKEWEESTGTE